MRRIQILLFVVGVFSFGLVQSQNTVNPEYFIYIENYKNLAIREMKLYKIPASITLAQGIIETNCGKSVLAVESKNHFGIKCHKEWLGEKYFYDDDEANECFRKYASIDESYRDHSLFLTTRSRYAFLFSLPITDYKAWANGLMQAGYATNPEYSNILIRIIEQTQLYKLDDTLMLDNNLAKKVEISVPQGNEKLNYSAEPFYSSGRVLFLEDYKQPDPTNFTFLYTSDLGRKVYENYGVAFIYAQEGDTWAGIAKEFKLYTFQMYKQNDMLQSENPIPGQIIYLEPKKRKLKIDNYTAKKGDSMYSISQQFCIRLKILYELNGVSAGYEPNSGTVIKLRTTSKW